MQITITAPSIFDGAETHMTGAEVDVDRNQAVRLLLAEHAKPAKGTRVEALKALRVTSDEIERRMAEGSRHRAVEEFLAEAGDMLSGLSRCAGIVLVDKQSKALRQVEFVHLAPGKALAVLVSEDGDVENRIIAIPEGLPLSSLGEASNYLNARIAGLTLAEARGRIEAEIDAAEAARECDDESDDEDIQDAC